MLFTRAMAILKEWRCAAHGPFESPKGKCPRGCSPRFVVQELRTAPAIRHGATASADSTARSLAESYGMSDIGTAREGESVMQALRKRPQAAPAWGDVPHAAPGWSQRGEKAPTFAPSSVGALPDNAIAPLQGSLSQPKPLIPKGGSYRAPLPE